MPLLGNDYAPPSNAPTGLVIHGQGPYVPPPIGRGREPTLGELISEGAGTISGIPGFVVRNIGPALVGRNLQGPRSSAEAFERLGANYDVPWQRALGHGVGAGLDIAADPMMLGGLGAANRSARAAAGAASAAEEALLMNRLKQYAVPATEEMSRTARATTGSRITPYNPSPPGTRLTPLTQPTLPTDIAELRRMGVTVPGPGAAPPAPPPTGLTLSPGHGVSSFGQAPTPSGSPAWLQGTPGPRGFPNFPTQLESANFMPGASSPWTSPLTRQLESMSPASPSRLSRMVPPANPTSMANEGNATMARQLEQFSPQGAIRGRTQPLGELVPFEQMGWRASDHTGLENEAMRAGFGDVRTYLASDGTQIRPQSLTDLSGRTGTTPATAGRDPFPNIPGLTVSDAAAVQPGMLPNSRADTVPNVMGRSPTSGGPFGPSYPPAPSTTPTVPSPFTVGERGQIADHLNRDQLADLFRALQREPGRGNTIGPRSQTIAQPPPNTIDPFLPSGRPPYRPPTDGPIDY